MSDQHIDELRAEAAARRQAIATDLELMGDRVSPTRIAERRKAQLRERAFGVRNAVFGSSQRQRTAGTYQGYATGTYATSPYESTSSEGRWQDESGNGQTDGGRLEALKDRAPDSLGEITEGNPFAAAVVGFGIGMLAATLLPSSPDEQRAARKLQGHLEDAGSAVGRSGKEALEHVKPEAQQAVQDVKESARESVESVKSDAQSKAEDLKGTAQDKAGEVRSQT